MRRMITLIVTTAVMLMTFLTLPALAAGDFTWSGEFQHRLQSRTYSTPNTGNHTVTKWSADCPGDGNNMRVRLVHEVGFGTDDYYEWKGWDCTDNNQSRTWASGRTEEFHFDVEKSDTPDSDTWTASGKTVYP